MKTILILNIMRLKFHITRFKFLMKRSKSLMWQQIILFYCCPVKIMTRFKNNISLDSRYVWYTYESF